MRTIAHACDTRTFGRRQPIAVAAPAEPATGINEDLRLFLWTFAAGFLAVSIYLA